MGLEAVSRRLLAELISAHRAYENALLLRLSALTPDLLEEGRFREVLTRVQTFRKELDLEYSGRIRLTLEGAAPLLDSVRPRLELLSRETLAVDVSLDASPAREAHVREVTIDGESLTLGLELV